MIDYINGSITEKTPTYVVIECAGVGYMIHISLNTYSHLPQINRQCKLLTHLQIKEDAHVLFGFSSAEERHMFRMLINVSGIGPSTAQMMLSAMSVSELVSCIASGNASALQTIKGIGGKTAQRITIELKDKVSKIEVDANIFSNMDNNLRAEALSALTSLGFAKTAAEKAVDKVIGNNDGSLSVEDIIKQSLKLL
ncbi:MAG: Holliday junction branch migration protein RuvA [Bacteroidales bacterium]|nr:Holliday junction branch migration protein RuvA [Bacteroidales bacterium]